MPSLPFSMDARAEAGFYCGACSEGEPLSMPHWRPMADVGPACHELRVNDRNQTWRIMYHVTDDAVVVLDVFSKKTESTPASVPANCRKPLAAYQEAAKNKEER